ncbi:hypothetical protein BKA80DRAFT_118029 [Phyllosticta citrichinensis]
MGGRGASISAAGSADGDRQGGFAKASRLERSLSSSSPRAHSGSLEGQGRPAREGSRRDGKPRAGERMVGIRGAAGGEVVVQNATAGYSWGRMKSIFGEGSRAGQAGLDRVRSEGDAGSGQGWAERDVHWRSLTFQNAWGLAAQRSAAQRSAAQRSAAQP